MRNKQKKIQLRDVLDVTDIIGRRWRAAVLACLCDSEKRFNEIKKDLSPITSSTLIKELKFLEESKLVDKKNIDDVTFYFLTEHGKSLDPLILKIVEWGQKHRKIILENY
jgi:DNA-binding HxlR family transcriptional regulator